MNSSSSSIIDTESNNQPKGNEEVIILSSLTKPRMKPTINSFEDLAAGKEVSILLRHDTVMGEQILKATSGVYKNLGDQGRRNSDRYCWRSVEVKRDVGNRPICLSVSFNIWTWNADVFVGTDILKLRKAQTSLASANNKKKQKQDLSLVVTLHSGWFISDS
ncbi:Uncharacterized protein APZ42_023601 [Daphnia magna]|uniref:Uncharacterized protein n=1 Tax=Daphnia magna TaxID=35525 RepID=A0A0P5CC10_9CRUS|nr:Uncharacterized protein APZ42_023601 [Daphnia magna]